MRVRSAARAGKFAQDSTAKVQDLLKTRGVGSDVQLNRTRQEGPYPQQRVMQQIGRQMNRVTDKVDCAANPRFAKRAVGPCAARTCNEEHPFSSVLLRNRFAFNRFGKAGLGWLSQPAGVGLLLIAVGLFGTDSTVIAQTFCDYLSGRSPSYQLRVANGFGRNNPTPRYPAAPWERVGVIGYAQPPAAIPPAIPATTSPPVISIPGPPTSPTIVPAPVGTPRPTVPGTAGSLQPTSSLPLQASTTTVPSAATRCGYPGSNCSQPGLAVYPAVPTTTAYAPQPTSAQPAYSQPSSVQPTYSQPAAPQPTQTVPAQAYPSHATSYPPTGAAPGLAPASAFQSAVATPSPVVSAAYPGSTVAAPPTYATSLPVSSTPPANAGLTTTYAAQTIAVIPVTTAMPVAPAGTACTTTGCQSLTNSTSLSLFRPTIRGFRSTLAQVPVTRWRPVLPTVSGVSVGRAPLQPCNSYEWQVRRVPTWGGGSPAGLIPVVVGQDTAVNMLGQRGTNALGAVPLYTTPLISGQTGMVVPSAGVPTVSTTATPVTPSGMAVPGTGAVAAPHPGANLGLAPNPLYGGATTGVVPGSAVPAAASNSYPSGTVPSTVQPPAAVAPRLSPGEVPAYRPILGSAANGTYSAGYPTVNQGASTGSPSWPPMAGTSPTAYPNAPANNQLSGPQTGTTQPAFSQPNYAQPAPPQPGYSQSTNAQSQYRLPTYGQPAYGQPAYGQPSSPQAAVIQPTPTPPHFPPTNTAQPAANQPGMMPFGQAVQSNMQAVGSAPAAPTHAADPNSVSNSPSSNSYPVGPAGGVTPSATSQPFGTSYSTPAGQPAVAPSTQQPAVVYPTPNQAPANAPTTYSSAANQANSFPAANGGLSTVAPVAGAQPYSGTATYPASSTTLPGTISGTNGGLGAAAAPASSPRNYYNVNPVPDPEAGLRSVPVSPSQMGPTSTSSPNQSSDTRFPAGMYVPISWPANPPATTPSPLESGVTRVTLVPTQAANSLPFAQPVTSLPQVDFSTPPQPSPSPSVANRLPVVPTPTSPQPGWDDSNWNATW